MYMKNPLIILIVTIIFLASTLYAADPVPKTIALYKGKRQPEEISTIFISETECLNHLYISEIDGQKIAEQRPEYHGDMNKYLVLPGSHKIAIEYLAYSPKKIDGKREKVFLETTIMINTKPNYYYQLFQNVRKYVSEPVTMRAHEYKPGEEYFDVYRMQVNDIRSQIDKLNPKTDSEKISDKYFELGRKYQDLREYTNAIEAYENAIKYNPKKPALYGMVVPSLIKLNEYAKAFEIIEKMKEYEKREWIIDGLYGEVYGAMNNYDKAIKSFEKAVNGAPIMNKDGIRGRLAYIYSKAGMNEKYRLTMIEVIKDREQKDALYLQITKEIAELNKEKAQFSEDERNAYAEARKRIMKKYDLSEDKLFEIVTSTMYKHEKEFGDKYIKKK